jgi:hypothetical protein
MILLTGSVEEWWWREMLKNPPHRDSNPRPSGLYNSVSTNYATSTTDLPWMKSAEEILSSPFSLSLAELTSCGPNVHRSSSRTVDCLLLIFFIRSHGNVWQSPGNALIYTSVFVAAETCFSYPLSCNGLFCCVSLTAHFRRSGVRMASVCIAYIYEYVN